MARILVVDDQPHWTLCLEVFLSRQGHEVTRASDGVAALRMFQHRSFDVLITDVDMPNMDGLTLVKQATEKHRLKGVIVLTGRTDFETVAAATLPASPVQVLPKPISPSRLATLVDGFLAENPVPS
ncbi:MAG: response regulator [Planctomycetota bacterium]|nr:MAG: response regulator [Planctomycetota bacterium]